MISLRDNQNEELRIRPRNIMSANPANKLNTLKSSESSLSHKGDEKLKVFINYFIEYIMIYSIQKTDFKKYVF